MKRTRTYERVGFAAGITLRMDVLAGPVVSLDKNGTEWELASE